MEHHSTNHDLKRILHWCASVVGTCELATGDARSHGRSSVLRLWTPAAYCYAKIHRHRNSWEAEVYGYEHWAPALGRSVPALLATHAEEPFALLLGELPGVVAEDRTLSARQEELLWYKAGQALATLHSAPAGEFFGPCRRDGTPAGAFVADPVLYVSAALEAQTAGALRTGRLSQELAAVAMMARQAVAVFAGERPVPCHRDYGPANWLVTDEGAWSGVIDFEMARWDVRVADFSRYPGWEWIHKPYLVDALLAGYGRRLTPQQEHQLLILRVLYALDAVTWGCEHSYVGFVQEGLQALEHVRKGWPRTLA